MEKEAAEILGLFKESLQELPTYGTEAWNMYVKGFRLEAGIWGAIQLLVVIYLAWSAIGLWRDYERDKDKYSEDIYLPLVIITCLCIIFIIIFGSVFVSNILKVTMPEYSIIKDILARVGD